MFREGITDLLFADPAEIERGRQDSSGYEAVILSAPPLIQQPQTRNSFPDALRIGEPLSFYTCTLVALHNKVRVGSRHYTSLCRPSLMCRRFLHWDKSRRRSQASLWGWGPAALARRRYRTVLHYTRIAAVLTAHLRASQTACRNCNVCFLLHNLFQGSVPL